MTNSKAQSKYAAELERAQALVAQLTSQIEAHKPSDNESIHYGHVGDLSSLNATLGDLVDRLSGEGEYKAA